MRIESNMSKWIYYINTFTDMMRFFVFLCTVSCLMVASCVGVSVDSRLTADDENAVDTVLYGVREVQVKSLFDVSVRPSEDTLTHVRIYVDSMEVKNYFSMDIVIFSVDCRAGVVEIAPDLPLFSRVVKAKGSIRIEIPSSVRSVTVDTPAGNIDVRGINVRKLNLRTGGGYVSVRDCTAEKQVIRQSAGNENTPQVRSQIKTVKKETIIINRD